MSVRLAAMTGAMMLSVATNVGAEPQRLDAFELDTVTAQPTGGAWFTDIGERAAVPADRTNTQILRVLAATERLSAADSGASPEPLAMTDHGDQRLIHHDLPSAVDHQLPEPADGPAPFAMPSPTASPAPVAVSGGGTLAAVASLSTPGPGRTTNATGSSALAIAVQSFGGASNQAPVAITAMPRIAPMAPIAPIQTGLLSNAPAFTSLVPPSR